MKTQFTKHPGKPSFQHSGKPSFQKRTAAPNPPMQELEREINVDFTTPFKMIASDKVQPLGKLVRAIGMVKGKLLEFDPFRSKGIVEIKGKKYKIEVLKTSLLRKKKIDFTKLVGQEIGFNFYPTSSLKGTKFLENPLELPKIKLAYYRKTVPLDGFVEAIGKLYNIAADHFQITLFSATQKKVYSISFVGKYPNMYDRGKYVRVTGILQENGTIKMVQAKRLSFATRTVASATGSTAATPTAPTAPTAPNTPTTPVAPSSASVPPVTKPTPK
jgi:cytochrome c-type biogenesis protein CcmE